jgi:hypothetical protein
VFIEFQKEQGSNMGNLADIKQTFKLYIMLIPFNIFRINIPMLTESAAKIKQHLDAASIHHFKAVALLDEGDYEKAAQNALLAQKYLDLASKAKREEQRALV